MDNSTYTYIGIDTHARIYTCTHARTHARTQISIRKKINLTIALCLAVARLAGHIIAQICCMLITFTVHKQSARWQQCVNLAADKPTGH